MDEPEWTQYLQQFALDTCPAIRQRLTKISPVGKTAKFCVIVEPRDHPFLLPVLRNFMYMLQPKGWGLIVFHGRNNEEVLQQEIAEWNCGCDDPADPKDPDVPQTISPVVLHKMDFDNLTIAQYSNLLCSADFWRTLRSRWGCEHALIFQVDTVLLRDIIDDFLQYDYIGAPFFMPYFRGNVPVGNGGLSLRKCIAMEKIASKCSRFIYLSWRRNRFHLENEDIFFSYWLYKYRGHFCLPTVDIANQFSIENVFFDEPCGMHKPDMSIFTDRSVFAAMFPSIIHTSV